MSSQKKKIRSKKFALIPLIIMLALMASFSFGYVYAQITLSFQTIIENGSLVEVVSYTIFQDGSYCYAKNGLTGAIDYYGTNASTVINSAIYAARWQAGIAPGGIVFIRSGTYYAHIFVQVGVEIYGEGQGNTIIEAPDGLDKPVIQRNGTDTVYGVKIKHLTVVGNKANQASSDAHGIDLTGLGDVHIDDVGVVQCKGSGFYTSSNTMGAKINNVIVSQCDRMGFEFTDFYTFRITNYYVQFVGLTSVAMNGGGEGTLENGLLDQSIYDHLHFYNVYHIQITDLIAYDDRRYAVFLEHNCLNFTFTNFELISNTTVKGPSGIRLSDSKGISFSNGRIIGYQNGISEDGTSDYNMVESVDAKLNDYGFTIIGSHTKIADSWNGATWVLTSDFQINSGTQTVNNGESVNHGLLGGVIPTTVIITARTLIYDGNVTVVGVATRDSAVFTVSVYWANGTAISNDAIVIDWIAVYKP